MTDRDRTHWQGCYTAHHGCAVTEVNRLRALLMQTQAEAEQLRRKETTQ